jgi:DnaJ family protein C protein 28
MPNIEELMRQAMADGKFNDLPGKGKPLHFEETNPHADPEWELAYKMLREAGYSLPWIEARREIDADLVAARQELGIAWESYQATESDHHRSITAAANWERSQSVFREKLDELNKRIRNFNLQVPNPHFQRPVLNFAQELQMITTQHGNE